MSKPLATKVNTPQLGPKCQYFVWLPLFSSTALTLLDMEFTRASQVATWLLFHTMTTSQSWWILAGADLVNWGPQKKYRNGALYICTHLPISTLRFLFVVMLAAGTTVPHSSVQCFYIFHVHDNGILSFRRHLFHVVAHTIAFDLPLRYKLTKN